MKMLDLTDVVSSMGAERWTALEHDGRSVAICDLAGWMRSAAALWRIEQGPVAISTADPIEHTVAALGAMAAGRPALLVDHRAPQAVLDEAATRANATAAVGRSPSGLEAVGLEALLEMPGVEPVSASPSEIGSILMTSGSTGQPKLVQRSRGADFHGSLGLRIASYAIGPGDRFWLSAPYSGSPFPGIVMAALVARATVVFAPFEAGSAGAFVDDQQITSAYIGPTPMRLIQSKGGLSHPGWSRLRSVLTGGERLDGDTAALMLDRFPDKVFLGYGATEVTRIAEATAADIAQHPGTVGRVLPLHQVQIVELGGTTPVAAGNQGEVLARGGSMFSGYLGEGPADEWYRTGDVGYLDADGFLYITGRATEVVQIGGNRVSTNEITSLLRSHADLADALVVAVDDPIWGSRLEGFVVAAPGTTVETAALESWLRGRVSAYKVPRRIHLLEQIPLDPSGKASLRTLADLARS